MSDNTIKISSGSSTTNLELPKVLPTGIGTQHNTVTVNNGEPKKEEKKESKSVGFLIGKSAYWAAQVLIQGEMLRRYPAYFATSFIGGAILNLGAKPSMPISERAITFGEKDYTSKLYLATELTVIGPIFQWAAQQAYIRFPSNPVSNEADETVQSDAFTEIGFGGLPSMYWGYQAGKEAVGKLYELIANNDINKAK